MPLEYTTTAQENTDRGVKLLIYGPSGIGKTMLAATAPEPIILSAESGLLSLSPRNIEKVFGVNTAGIVYKPIPVIKIKTVQDLIDAYSVVSGVNGNMFQTIFVDSLTEIAETVLSSAKLGAKDPRQAYGVLLEQMISIVKQFRDLPNKNVCMLAKMESSKDELTGITSFGPAMPGQKLGPQLPYLFDEVLRLGVNKDQNGNPFRFFQTQPDIQFTAKDRSGILDPVEFPSLTSIFNKINGAT